ncbi:hypothetical protein EGW08_001239, partial [Elysia chlorotica]
SQCSTIPPGPSNGNQTFEGDGTSYGTIVRFSCDPGYDLIGNTTMLCDSNGQWVGIMPSCKILTCYMPDVPHGTLSANTVEYLRDITLTCDDGYKTSINAINTMSCTASRTLEPQLSCLNIDECAELKPCNMSCFDLPGSYRCECDAGYEVQGNECLDINECTQMNPCDQLCSNLLGSFECSCTDGYTLFNSVDGVEGYFLPPGEDGTRKGDKYLLNRTCVPKQCNAPVIPPNGALLNQSPRYYFNDTIEFKCKLGYRLETPGSGQLVCGSDRTWQGPQVICQRIMCDVEPLSASSLINPGVLTPTNVTSIEFGSSVSINCTRPGLRPVPNFTRTRRCTLINGQYRLDGSVQDYECGVIDCGQPESLTGASYTNVIGTQYGDTAIFGCEAQYTLTGASSINKNTTITCQANGMWDFGSLTCSGKSCADPGQIQFGVQKVSDYRNHVVFECIRRGFELKPPGSLACELSSNGTASYNASLPACVDVNPPVLLKPCANGAITLELAKYTSVGDSVPVIMAIDRETGIKELVIEPAWPSRREYITSAAQVLTFTYTFSDFAGNKAVCKVYVKGKDTTRPSITCPSSAVGLDYSEKLTTVTDDFSKEENITVSYDAPKNLSWAIPFLRINGTVVTATATDEAGNQASCKFDVFYTGDVCSKDYVRQQSNSLVACQNNNPGVTCTVTCDPGYRLFEDVSQSSVTFSCPGPNQPFQRNTDVTCVNIGRYMYYNLEIELNKENEKEGEGEEKKKLEAFGASKTIT